MVQTRGTVRGVGVGQTRDKARGEQRVMWCKRGVRLCVARVSLLIALCVVGSCTSVARVVLEHRVPQAWMFVMHRTSLLGAP